jgi:dTDP-4-amino-4,6-dideoxygalactose transaminase
MPRTVTASNWYILGQEGAAFEEEFALYVGAAQCVGVANRTDAIELALRALGVRAGSRVATAANAAFYTTTAPLAIGAEPVYVDVDRSTHLMT